MDLNTYEVLKTAYCSRLLFRSDSEYRECIGVTFETVSDNRNDRRTMTAYYDALDTECVAKTCVSLRSLVEAYVSASDVAQSIDFDWGDRRQMASRKRFVRMLIRHVAAPTIPLSLDEELKFKPRECDKRLIQTIFPNGSTQENNDQLIFLALLTFGIVKPCRFKSVRSRNIGDIEASEQLSSMIEMVKIIQDDLPQIGVLSKPLVFEQVLNKLNSAKNDYNDCTPAWFWTLLSTIVDSCAVTASPTLVAASLLQTVGYSMPGIWIDDADGGCNRFWIFPENKYMAFCYTRNGECWTLTPYEICFYSSKRYDEISDVCVFVTAKGNMQLLTNPTIPIDKSEIATMEYSIKEYDSDGRFQEISFKPLTVANSTMFDWKKFTRLRNDDKLFEHYAQFILELYNPLSPRSVLFTNTAPVMTDALNCLIAIDSDYIYISDILRPDRFVLEEDPSLSQAYYYNPNYRVEPPRNLISLEVSSRHPLYLLPRNAEKRGHVPNKYKKLIEAIDNTEIEDQITLYQVSPSSPKLLCFNRFSCIYPLDDLLCDLSRLGATCITSLKAE